MFKPVGLPRGVANLLSQGLRDDIIITEDVSYRPDKILTAYGLKSFKHEAVNNWLSNTSPISCVNNTDYSIAGNMFMAYFTLGS